jgi:hypothetical protein
MPNGSSQTGDGGASGNGRKAEGWEGNLLPTFVVNPLSGCLACRFFFLSGGEFFRSSLAAFSSGVFRE